MGVPESDDLVTNECLNGFLSHMNLTDRHTRDTCVCAYGRVCDTTGLCV